jgi:hypothetical protein
MVLGSERIDASINADVANGKLWTLDKVRYLINGSIAEAAYSSCHRPSPSMSLAILASPFGPQGVLAPCHTRRGRDVRSAATISRGLPLRWRHSLAPIKGSIFFGRPIPLMPPCPKVGFRSLRQKDPPRRFEVGAGLVQRSLPCRWCNRQACCRDRSRNAIPTTACSKDCRCVS